VTLFVLKKIGAVKTQKNFFKSQILPLIFLLTEKNPTKFVPFIFFKIVILLFFLYQIYYLFFLSITSLPGLITKSDFYKDFC
jgi:hypothetical protein